MVCRSQALGSFRSTRHRAARQPAAPATRPQFQPGAAARHVRRGEGAVVDVVRCLGKWLGKLLGKLVVQWWF